MKPISVIIFLLVSILTLTGFSDTRLRMRVTAVDPEAEVWDFSGGEEMADGPLYRSYGDTLLTEYVGGQRQWYGFRGDSAFYMGEESRLMKIVPEDTVWTAAFGNARLFGVQPERGKGSFCRQFPLGTSGVYKTEPPVYGKLVLAEGDTIPAVAVTEQRKFSQWLHYDTLPGTAMEMLRTRWFIEGVRLPVALQITEFIYDGSRVVSSATAAYTVEGEMIENSLTESQKIDRALQRAEISVENGTVTVRGEFPEGAVLTLSIAGIMGSGLVQQPLATGGDGTYTCTLPSLNQGQYMLTISAGTLVSRKMIITI